MKKSAVFLVTLLLLAPVLPAAASTADTPVFPPAADPTCRLPAVDMTADMAVSGHTLPNPYLPTVDTQGCTVILHDGTAWLLPDCSLR